MKKMNGLDWLALVLLIIGGLNWGLIGFFGFDLVAFVFGSMTFLARLIYALVGISAIYTAFLPAMMGSDESTYVSGRPSAKSM